MPIDPSIVLGIKQGPTFQQRQAADIELEGAQAQTELRQAEATRAQIANRETQAKQQAGKAVQAMLQQKASMKQTPTAGDFWLAAGPYGDDYLKSYHTGVTTDIANRKAQLDNAAKVADYAGGIVRGMMTVKDQHERQSILANGVQTGIQQGVLDEETGNALLKQGTTDAELQAELAQHEPQFKAYLDEQHKQFDEAQKKLDYDLKVKAEDRQAAEPKVVDGNLVGPDGKVLFTAPKIPPQPSAGIQEYNFYVDQENKAGRKPMTFDEYQTRDANRKASASVVPVDIAKGTKNYRVAQDLAYGKLTFSDFKSLYGRAAATAELKTSLYDKARELNPEFNPAAFEMGFKLASNPKVQQQLASMDNVKEGVPDLLKFSDLAARSNYPVLNKYVINPGGIALGDKKYSNLAAARVGFADELSGALGFGGATDMSKQMGFDMTDTNLSPEAFRAGIQDVVLPFIERKKSTLLKQMGVYGQPGMNPASDKPAAPDDKKDPLGIRKPK